MNKILRSFLDILYPQKSYCVICECQANAAICKTCASSIKFMNERTCLKCGKGLDDIYCENLCPDCKNITHCQGSGRSQGSAHYFDSAYSCFQYEGMGKALIHAFKYKGRTQVAELLSNYLYEKIEEEYLTGDFIAFVPIHESKLQKRGFNQSKLIAEKLSKQTGIKSIDCLKRDKDTEKQYNLSKEERFHNVYNAFSGDLSYNVNNKNIILVDDIYTTGSTADECSKVLKSMGAARIIVITAASGKNT